jgi:hypothetical protein
LIYPDKTFVVSKVEMWPTMSAISFQVILLQGASGKATAPVREQQK